jgi:hypothetical protein
LGKVNVTLGAPKSPRKLNVTLTFTDVAGPKVVTAWDVEPKEELVVVTVVVVPALCAVAVALAPKVLLLAVAVSVFEGATPVTIWREPGPEPSEPPT